MECSGTRISRTEVILKRSSGGCYHTKGGFCSVGISTLPTLWVSYERFPLLSPPKKKHTHTHIHTNTHTHTRTHAHTHARTHARRHAHTYTHTFVYRDIFLKQCILIPNTTENNYDIFLQQLRNLLSQSFLQKESKKTRRAKNVIFYISFEEVTLLLMYIKTECFNIHLKRIYFYKSQVWR